MTVWLTRLTEDPRFGWRIHGDEPVGQPADRSVLLTDKEMKSLIKSYYDWQDVDEVCPACGKDPMAGQVQ